MGRKRKEGSWVEVEGWTGKHGRVWRDQDGTQTFHIRKSIGGRAYSISTRTSTIAAALKHLEAFEKDPAGYQPGGKDPIYLDEKLSEAFLAFSLAKGNTVKHRKDQKRYLAWWADRLAGVDLRRAGDRIHSALDRPDAKKCRQQRIAVLKVLYSWMRTETHAIATVEDPTYGQIKVPQSKPEQSTRVKVVPAEHVALVIAGLASNRWRDLLRVLAGTGMHVSELERFAASGSVEPLPRDGKAEGSAGVLLIPQTKAGDPLRVAISQEVLDAAIRVREAGSFDRQKFSKAIKSACLAVNLPDGKVGIPVFGPGRLRHTVATFAVNAGAAVSGVASFLNHKSPRTTARFYATHATPAKVPTLM